LPLRVASPFTDRGKITGMNSLPERRIGELFEKPPEEGYTAEDEEVFRQFKQMLNSGEVRAAVRDRNGSWRISAWVKQGILLGFRMGVPEPFSIDGNFRFFDKHTFPLKRIDLDSGVRLVPGGSSVRDGVFLGKGTPVFDLVKQADYRKQEGRPLKIPSRAVVVPGSRPAGAGWGRGQGLSLYTPVIVKYRDAKTDAGARLENLLR